jgi:hypothetical protein
VLGGSVRVSGRLGNLTAAAEGTDAVNKAQMDASIALATTSTSPGTLRVTASDTTAKFLDGAISVSGALTKSVINPGGNEALAMGVTPYLSDGGISAASFTVMPGTRYIADCRAGPIIATLDASWNMAGLHGEIVKVGTGLLTLAQGPGPTKINGVAASDPTAAAGVIGLHYVDSAFGVLKNLISDGGQSSEGSASSLNLFSNFI